LFGLAKHASGGHCKPNVRFPLCTRGAEPLGEVAQHENIFRLCYLRGPAGNLVALAEQSGRPDRR
jgi:hypothetical protein